MTFYFNFYFILFFLLLFVHFFFPFTGAIFEGSDLQMESIFRQTVNRINLDKSRTSKPRLEVVVSRINQKDSFHAAKVGQCQILKV